MIMQPRIADGKAVLPRPSVFDLIVRGWFGLLNAIVWCLTLSTGCVVRRHGNRYYQKPPIY